jgi:hypothetical protein
VAERDDPDPERAPPERGRAVPAGRGWLERGALEETIGRASIDCSREQIGQFWMSRLWRQKVGTST